MRGVSVFFVLFTLAFTTGWTSSGSLPFIGCFILFSQFIRVCFIIRKDEKVLFVLVQQTSDFVNPWTWPTPSVSSTFRVIADREFPLSEKLSAFPCPKHHRISLFTPTGSTGIWQNVRSVYHYKDWLSRTSVSPQLVSWCFDPSQPQRVSAQPRIWACLKWALISCFKAFIFKWALSDFLSS